MTALDPPAAAARRQHAIDRITEDLVGWGCPLDTAPDRARQLLDHALAAGYRLPEVLTDAPHPRGPGSTPTGRAHARAMFQAARRQRETTDSRPQIDPGAPGAPGSVSQAPPNAPRGAEGVAP